MKIKEALETLDVLDDDLWTSDGLPKVSVVADLVGHDLTRQQITDAAPHFTRASTTIVEPTLVLPERDLLGFALGVPASQLEQLKLLLEEKTRELTKAVSALQEQDYEVRQIISRVAVRIKAEVPRMSDAEANRVYIETQAAIRAAQFEATDRLLKGVDLADLDPRSKIDQAMARKTARGTNRPKVN